MTIIVSKDSHVDHGLTAEQLSWVVAHFADRTGFFIGGVELPEGLGTVPCGLHGPTMGDEPVAEAEVFYAKRGTRANDSRLCKREPRQVRLVTVIAGPHGSEPMVLYTAFGGPLAEREPGDPGLKTPEEQAKAKEFWATHALSA